MNLRLEKRHIVALKYMQLGSSLVVDSHHRQLFFPSGHHCSQLLNVNAQMTISRIAVSRIHQADLIFYHKGRSANEIMQE